MDSNTNSKIISGIILTQLLSGLISIVSVIILIFICIELSFLKCDNQNYPYPKSVCMSYKLSLSAIVLLGVSVIISLSLKFICLVSSNIYILVLIVINFCILLTSSVLLGLAMNDIHVTKIYPQVKELFNLLIVVFTLTLLSTLINFVDILSIIYVYIEHNKKNLIHYPSTNLSDIPNTNNPYKLLNIHHNKSKTNPLNSNSKSNSITFYN